ncbi:hypothetical protein EBN03_24810 [Nocardia stercoris]|uniref:Uncharacterized protein n=1 Tax=Nocardia stercoris TaxID=2483361 RepID=A0A3M2L1G1_9NOCA|nr:hypothetical protein EBN03_24810 [Nocardia stercoris]
MAQMLHTFVSEIGRNPAVHPLWTTAPDRAALGSTRHVHSSRPLRRQHRPARVAYGRTGRDTVGYVGRQLIPVPPGTPGPTGIHRAVTVPRFDTRRDAYRKVSSFDGVS